MKELMIDEIIVNYFGLEHTMKFNDTITTILFNSNKKCS